MSSFKQNLEKKSNEQGLFAKVDFQPHEVLFEFTGNFFKKDELGSDKNIYIQIGKDLFMGPSGDLDDSIEHNCNCNCYLTLVGKRVLLKALHFIKAGTEVTLDYSITSTATKDEWQLNCQCHPYRCRKIVSGFQYLDQELKDKYEKLGIVPKYVLNEENNI